MDFLAISFERVEDWISAGGYIMLFTLLFTCGLGLPLPEDIPLIIAGALCGSGRMHWIAAGIVAWCGIIGGDIILYHVGKKFGLGVTRLPFIGKHLTRQRIERVEVMFDKYGIGVVAIGRLFAGIRGAMVVAAGAIRFSFWKFLITDGLAAVVSGGFFMAVGFWLGQNLTEQNIKRFKHYFAGGAIIVAAIFVAWHVWRKRMHRPDIVEVEARGVEKVLKTVETVKHPAPKDAG